jgi:uncharacterized protein YgiM (DUF1202 family)
MRHDPGTNASVVKSVPDGAEVVIIGTDREADGRLWRNVQDESGASGWIVSTALRPLPTPTVTPSSTPTPAATATGTATPTATATTTAATPTSAATATPAATPVPEQVEVTGTGSQGANLRAEPSTTAPVLRTVPDGTRLTVTGPDREADGWTWRNVQDENGTSGWVVVDAVRSLATPTPAATATPTASPTATASPAGTPAAGASETATPTRTPEPSGTPGPESDGPEQPEETEPDPEVERVEVYGTDPQGANLRAAPGRSGTVLRSIPDGTQLTVVGEDQQADGLTWRNVRTEDGTTGWLAVEVIRTIVTPTPTPRPGAPGIGAPLPEDEEPEDQLTEAERAARPCRPGQLKGDAATGTYYLPDHPDYPTLLQRVRCFDDVDQARSSGYLPPAPPASPSPTPE